MRDRRGGRSGCYVSDIIPTIAFMQFELTHSSRPPKIVVDAGADIPADPPNELQKSSARTRRAARPQEGLPWRGAGKSLLAASGQRIDPPPLLRVHLVIVGRASISTLLHVCARTLDAAITRSR